MLKRSILSVALVATMACQPLLAIDDEIGEIVNDVANSAGQVVSAAGNAVKSAQPMVIPEATGVAPSLGTALKEAATNCFKNIASVFSPSVHATTCAAVKNVYTNDGFKAACGTFFENKATVAATALTVAACAAVSYAAYKYVPKYFASNQEA